jgi:hypothetical protein
MRHLGLESNKDGLGFSYWDLSTGKFSKFVRTRLDIERGEGQKYSQPKGSGVKLYFPPTYLACSDEKLKARALSAINDGDDKPRSVVIVEGEKKALALQHRLGPRVVVIGIGGVWNWGVKSDDGDRVLVNDFKLVKSWKDRTVYLCFDSDVTSNPHVERAEYMLQTQLRVQFGVRARLITLEDEKGEKQGIDDLVAAYGDSFPKLWAELKQDSVTGARYTMPRPISGQELCETDWDFEDVILSDGEYQHLMVESGTSFIHAGSGVGKTYFLLQLSACLASGREFLGFKTSKRNVLFLQQELSNGWFARRVRRLRDVFGEPVDTLSFISGDFPLASVDKFKTAKLHLGRLERLIVRNDVEVCILDPLQGFYDLSESSTDHAREFMKAVTSVSKKTGCHIIMSHHDRKDTTGQSIAQMRGGSPFSDLADTVIGVKRLPLYERADNGKWVKMKDDFGEVLFHPSDLVLNFDKVRHCEGPLPDRMELMRMPQFDNGDFNPFFQERGQEPNERSRAPF